LETRYNESSPIVRVEGLVKSYDGGKTRAVDGVSFEVKQGEIFGFLGPNGAGKSTTINMLTTLLPPTSGMAEVCGLDVHKHANEVRRSVGVVPQDYTADEDMTGFENILLCADLYGLPRSDSTRHAQELLQLVELQDAAKRKVSTFSGGMRRRLELACGLINYPKLLFLDEPTLGLDVQTRAAVWKYIRQLKKDYNMTLFLTTHYLEEADALCDRVAIIDHGRIVAEGTPLELKRQVAGDVVTIGIAGDVGPSLELLRAQDFVREANVEEGHLRLYVDRGETAMPAILRLLDSTGVTLETLELHRPSLDDVFLRQTGRSLREEAA
jgi:ABC-2 type transport system ATP-binding protein